jgi:hypothetical protein
MKQLLVWVLCSILTAGCTNNFAMDREIVVGKYVNDHEKGAIHYIKLFSDSTFLHYYKNHDGIFENKGTWKYYGDDKKEKISFSFWQSMGVYKETGCINECLRIVEIKNGELIFDVDLPSEKNFRKVTDDVSN